MSHDNINLKEVEENFLKELNDAKAGKKTSLPFILHKVSTKPIVEEGEVFQVLVIGGTIFRKALVKKENGKLIIHDKEEKYQPPFHHKDDFEHFLEKEISPNVSLIALNFAYPLKPVFENGKIDGILVSGTKENVFGDMIGKRVGREIEKFIQKTQKRKIKVAVANDTVCLLFAGLTKFSWDELAAGVIGTGMNFAFFLNSDTVVNLESGNFNKFPQTPEARLIDTYSTNVGAGLFEKEVAGAYLYKHFNLIRELKSVNHSSIDSTEELDRIAQQRIPDVSALAKALLQNSAELVAAQIGGLMLFKQSSLTFAIEGSLFWLSDAYRKNVQNCLKKICPQYKARFVRIEQSTILGAAKLIA
ncbi:hypothetical protein HY024_02020 [Candidatus Curtissbacteria bacterium]|nr:hypothetical protein [Candidatus Curtissbacteria bacterium]